MRLTALQLPARFDSFDVQARLAETLLESGPTDLVLFSEAALTGYVSPRCDFDLTRFAEPLERGKAAQLFTHLARRFDCLVVGPVIEANGDRCFNSLLGIAPDGRRLVHYRKRHPWMPETWATAGETSGEPFEWRGTTFLPAICFDVHFLRDDAAAGLRAADVLLFASAWVDEGSDARPAHFEALSREFSLSVLNANWGDGRPRIEGQGGSLFMTAEGDITARLDGKPGRLDVSC